MRDEQQLTEDAFVEGLVALDEAMEKGETVDGGLLKKVDGQSTRLHRGLNCLKLLDGLRRRQDSTFVAPSPLSLNNFASVETKLPARFGKFELLQELGRGGFGVVFLARDRSLECEVALKMPHSHVLTNDELRERFRREARAAAGLHHPHIVTVREAGQVGPVTYLVSAYCSGPTLGDWLRMQKDPVPHQLAARWLAELAEAVAYAHLQGVFHRDLKPGNILLQGNQWPKASASSESYVPKITDFGLAKLEREDGQTATGALLGTPAYIAPEQALGKKSAGAGVDIHALGVILYELLAGRVPYRGETDAETLQLVRLQEPVPLRKLRPGVPRDLETICHKCLQKDPAHRYGSAAELAEDLRRFLNGRHILARPVSLLERSWRACRRHPLVTGLSVALVLAVLVGGAGVIWQSYERLRQAAATQALLDRVHEWIRGEVDDAQKLLADAGTEKLGREKILHCLDVYETLLKEPLAAQTLHLEVARLANQAGYLHFLLAQYPQAIPHFQRSIDLYKSVRAKKPTDRGLVLEHARVIARLATLHRSIRKWEESEPLYQQAMTLVTGAPWYDADDPETMAFLGETLVFNCYNLNQLNRSVDAEKGFQEVIRLMDRGLARRPADRELLLTKALALDDFGTLCVEKMRYGEAEELLRAAFEIRNRFFTEEPKIMNIRLVTARSYWKLGDLFNRTGRKEDGERYFLTSLRMNDELRKEFPGVSSFTHNAAADRTNLGTLLISQGRYDEAEQYFRQAVEEREVFARRFSHHEANRRWLSRDYFLLAQLLADHGRSEAADNAYAAGLDVAEQLTQEFAEETRHREFHLSQLSTVAQFYEKSKQLAKLIDASERITQAREKLVQDWPQVVQYQRDLDQSYQRLSSQYERDGRHQDAAHAMSLAAATRLQVVHSREATSRDRQMLAIHYQNWALQEKACGHLPEADRLLQQAWATIEPLEPTDPSLTRLTLNKGDVLMHLGHLHAPKEPQKALTYYLRALPFREQLVRETDTRGHISTLAKCHFHLYETYLAVGQDPMAATRHYIVSCLYDERFCKPPIQVAELLELIARVAAAAAALAQ